MTNGQPLIIDGDPKARHAAYAITFSDHDVYSLQNRTYEGDAWVVAKEADLGEVPPAVLVELYNRAAEADGAKIVTKFASRDVMHRRVWPVIELLARPVPAKQEEAAGDAAQETSTSDDSQSENGTMNALERKKRAAKRTNAAKKSTTKRAAAKKQPAANGMARPGRPSGMSGKTIHLKTREDPTREGSARKASWKILKDGMSFDDYIKKGGDTNHLRVFIAQGHLSVR